MYGSETWIMKMKNESRTESTKMKFLWPVGMHKKKTKTKSRNMTRAADKFNI
jgi:hypothetical protein